jgi:hypothetical protein
VAQCCQTGSVRHDSRVDGATRLLQGRQSDDRSPAVAPDVTARRRRLHLPTRPWLQFLVAFALLAVLLVLVRGSLLWTAGMQNPDEAELMAEGRTAALNLFPYSGYTSSTHLFLWPFLLGVLDLVGIPLNLVTAHVMAGLSFVLLSTTGWFLMMRRIGGLRAALLVLPTATVLFMGYAPGTSDFLSMTSEALPLVILAITALIMLGPARPMTTGQLVAGSVVAGLAVWAKPQSGPVAVALVAACVLMTWVERQRYDGDVRAGSALRFILRSGSVALLAFATPTVVFLAAMLLGGTLDDFAREPVAAIWNYTAHRDTSQGVVAPPLGDRLVGVYNFAKTYPFAAAWALGAVLTVPLLARLRSNLLRGIGLVAMLLPAVASLACLLPIHPLFPHYASFFYAGCLLASCVAVRLADPARDRSIRRRWVELVCVAVVAVMAGNLVLDVVGPRLSDLARQSRAALSGDGFDFENHVPRDATPLGAECPAGSRVVVWGWASELYAYYDWVPASRYVNSSWIVYPSRNSPKYAAIMMRELRADPPDCILEALGPAFFAGLDPSWASMTVAMPDVSSLLESCYTTSTATLFDTRQLTLHRRTGSCADS